MLKCEEWLLAAGTITNMFTAAEIQGGILKDWDPQKVITHDSIIIYICSHVP